MSTTYKILSIILLSRLTPYVEENIWDHQCGFLRNMSTIDRIFCVCQILEKKIEIQRSSALATYILRESLCFVMKEVLYNILIEISIHM